MQQYLRSLREATRPSDLGLKERPSSRPGPRVKGVTQEQVNTLLGWGRNTYQALEKQTREFKTPHILEVAELFDLDEEEYRQLHLLALGSLPPHPRKPETGVVIPSQQHWQRVVDGQSDIAYLTNAEWSLVVWNRPFARLFNSLGYATPPENMMEWMLFSELARQKVLLDWESSWAPPILAQLHGVATQNPNNAKLAQLMERVRQDPLTRRIHEAGVRTYAHPDGDMRPLFHPDQGRGKALMVSAHPSSALHARLIVVLFTPDPLPEPTRSAEQPVPETGKG
ncbi:helix-turn-helix domain-containing protein [Streptomyces sp. G44]|nr:helix-turn-helix domain-containing protein [Streptomyces sp. G44]